MTSHNQPYAPLASTDRYCVKSLRNSLTGSLSITQWPGGRSSWKALSRTRMPGLTNKPSQHLLNHNYLTQTASGYHLPVKGSAIQPPVHTSSDDRGPINTPSSSSSSNSKSSEAHLSPWVTTAVDDVAGRAPHSQEYLQSLPCVSPPGGYRRKRQHTVSKLLSKLSEISFRLLYAEIIGRKGTAGIR